jgi:hypothetical protein
MNYTIKKIGGMRVNKSNIFSPTMPQDVKVSSYNVGHKIIMTEGGKFGEELSLVFLMSSPINNNQGPIAFLHSHRTNFNMNFPALKAFTSSESVLTPHNMPPDLPAEGVHFQK